MLWVHLLFFYLNIIVSSMDNRFFSLKKKVDEDIKDAFDSHDNSLKHGLTGPARKKLNELSDKYKSVLEELKTAKSNMAGVNSESNFEFKNINIRRMDPESIGENSYSGVHFVTEDGTEVKGTNGVKNIKEMSERLNKIKNTVFAPRGSDTSKRNRFHCEYNLNSTSFFWKKMDFNELYIGSPMAQLEFLFYMMMCYDSRDVHPTYDPESSKMFELDPVKDKPTSSVKDGIPEARFAGPTMRLPDEYRALAKCMMKDNVERNYLIKYGIPFGERSNKNINNKYDRNADKYSVKWYDSNNNVVYPDIQFDVGIEGRTAAGGAGAAGAAAGGVIRETPGGQIAGIIQYYNLNGDGTDGLNMPGFVGVPYDAIGGHSNGFTATGFTTEDNGYYDGTNADVNNITLSMRGLNRRGFDLHVPAGAPAPGASGAKNYQSPFLPTLTEDNDHNRQHIRMVTNTTGYNVFNTGTWGPAVAGAGVPVVAGLNGNFNNENATPGLNSVQNRYILTSGPGHDFVYRDSFSVDHTGNALDAVKRGAIFGAYFGEPCLDDNSLQMTVAGLMISCDDNSAPRNPANFTKHNIPNIYLRRFRHSGTPEYDDRRRGKRNSNAGYVFKEKTIYYDANETDTFGTTNDDVINSWANDASGLAFGNGFIGNERGIGTTTYTTSRLSLLYDIVYSNPFGATNPTGNQSRGYVDMMHNKRRGTTLKEGQAPGHICTPRDFYVKCVLGRYVMFWNQDGTPAKDCWDQEYFPAPGCVKQIFGNANSGGDYVYGVEDASGGAPSDAGKVTATILDRALPKVVHYAGRKVPQSKGYKFSERGFGDDAYCDYDGTQNRGCRNASGSYKAKYTSASSGFTGETDFGRNAPDPFGGVVGAAPPTPAAPIAPDATDRIIVRTDGEGINKKQTQLNWDHAKKTVLTNFFCGNFSAAYQGTEAWDSIYQAHDNDGLAQYDGGYKTNIYLKTTGDHTDGDYLKLDNNGDNIIGKVTLAPQFNNTVNASEFGGNATKDSAFVYNKMEGTTGGVNVQYLPVSGVAPFNNFKINNSGTVVAAQARASGGVMKYIRAVAGAGLPTVNFQGIEEAAGVNSILPVAPPGGAANQAVEEAGITADYGEQLKQQGYCRYDLPGAQLSNSTAGAMFNAYRGLFSPMNIPTNIEIFAFCHNFARMIFNNLDEEKYPILKKSVEGRRAWTNRMATKMAASISKIRELIFTDDLKDSDILKELVPFDPKAYASNTPENNKLELLSVNDGLPGGEWKKLFKNDGNPTFNGIISNPNLRQAIINIINKMIISRGNNFSGSGSLPKNIEYKDENELVRKAVRFTSEGMLRDADGLEIKENYDNVNGRKTQFDLIKRDSYGNIANKPIKDYLPADCGRCDHLAIIDMGELYDCNLYNDGSTNKLYLFDYIQTRLAENDGYIAKGVDLSRWIVDRDYYKNLNINKYGGIYKAPAYGGIIQQYDQDGIKSSYWTASKIYQYFSALNEFWEEMIQRIQTQIGQKMFEIDQSRLKEFQNNLQEIKDIIKGFIDSLALGDKERIEQDKQLIEMAFTQHLDNVRTKQNVIDNLEIKLKGLKGKAHEIRLAALKRSSRVFLHSETVKLQMINLKNEAKGIKVKIEEARFEKRMYSKLVYEYFRLIENRLSKAENRGTTGEYSKEIREQMLFMKKRLENMAVTALGATWKEGIEKEISVLDQLASKPEMARRVADLKRYSDILKKDFNGGLWVPITYKKLLGKKVGLLNILSGVVIPDWDDLSKRTEFKGTIVVTSTDLKSEWYYMMPPDGEFPPKKKGISVVDEEILKAYRLKLFTGYVSMQSAPMRTEASAFQSQSSTGVNRAIWWATNGMKCGKGSVGDCPTKEECASRSSNDPANPCGRVMTMADAVTIIKRTVLADDKFEKSQLVTRLISMSGGRKKGVKKVRKFDNNIFEDMMKQFDL